MYLAKLYSPVLCVAFFSLSCQTQQVSGCGDIQNMSKSASIPQIDSVCKDLERLSVNDLRFRFYIHDEFPSTVEMAKRSKDYFATAKEKKVAVVFINFSTKEFAVIFNDYLKRQERLPNRQEFNRNIYQFLKESNDSFFNSVISAYVKQFGESGKRAF